MKKRAEMRKKVKTHIKRRGDEEFVLTEAFCLYWWRYLNEAVFDGVLNPPKRFEFRRFRHLMVGYCQPFGTERYRVRRVSIGISTLIQDRKTFLEILGHEMVHQWEWEIAKEWDDNKGGHGPQFYQWREPLAKRAGLTLCRRYSI